MSDGKNLMLSFAPSLCIRLLRQESTIVSTEAALLSFLAKSSVHDENRDEDEEKKNDEEEGGEQANSLKIEDGDAEKPTGLPSMVPKLLKHSSTNCELAYPYSIIEQTIGEPLSNLAPFLSVPERRSIDRQVGAMARTLADLTPPTKLFGMAKKVLRAPWQSSSPPAPPITGPKTWPEGFNTLLESILRDGEDMAVLLPYEVIRSHFQRLAWRLEAVLVPRLVILDVDDPENVLVERDQNEGTTLSSQNIRMTGLQSWSRAVFGDPLIASCFDEPKEGFLEGWDEAGEGIIEDEENSETRRMLYCCYRAVVEVVTEYYRPRGDSSRRELAGRRKLTHVLAELQKVDIAVNDAPKRIRSLSTDAEPSKRIKTEAEGE